MRKAKAELLRQEAELSNLLKRQEVEREMERQIAGMKAQEEELRSRIALLTAEGEIEKAKVVDEFYEALECSKRTTKAELKPVWTEKARLSLPPTKQPHNGSNVKNGDSRQAGRNELKSEPNPSAEPWDPGPPRNVTSSGGLTRSQQLQQLLTQQQEALQLMAVSIQQGFEMPKRELLTFDGNPLNYWLFINNFEVNIALNRVWTVDTLCLPLGSPPTKEDTSKWPQLNGIDFPRTQSDKVSALIGSDVPEAHWVCDQRRGRRGQPYAVCTPLGWTLMGPLNSFDRDCFSVNFVRYDDEMLHRQMESMFRSDFNEPMITSKVAMSVEDQRALTQMESSVKLVNGHYQLGLPWKHDTVNLPNNREFAMGRSCYLKKRFQ